MVILPETTAQNACIAAEKMRIIVESETFELGGDSQKLTMSFGVAGITETVTDVEELIKRADAAMYRTKDKGRNRVELYVEDLA